MKVAEARYTGRMRSANKRAPSGTRFHFPRYGGADVDREWVAVESREDAEWLAERPDIELRWKPLGRLRAAGEDAVAAVSDLSYNAKQKLVGEDGFDLDVAGNASDDEMEEALREHVKSLEENGEL